MAGIKIKPETGGEEGGFWLLFVGAFVSMGIAGNLLAWLGIDVPLPQNPLLRIVAFLLFVVVSFAVVMGASILVTRAANALLAATAKAAFLAVLHIEALLTAAVERGRPLLIPVLLLPLLPLRIAASWLYSSYLAPAAERRRQRAELRRLFDEVRDDYASFDEFVRQFEGGGSKDRSRFDEPAPAEPADQFASACRTFGLPEDGAFSAAHLKARYLEIMKAIHPDVIGPNVFATQLNEARALIKSRKGWK